MSKGAQLSDEKYIAFACVRFKDQSKEEYSIVPVDYVKQKFGKILKDFQPSDENDFIRNEFYYALWKCPDSCAEDHEHKSFYKANILHLGESESDIKMKITSRRVKFPNKKYCDTSSSTEPEGGSKSFNNETNEKVLKERTLKLKQKKAAAELHTFKADTNKTEFRSQVVESDEDNEPGQTDPRDLKKPGMKGKAKISRGSQGSAASLEGIQEETNASVHDRNGEYEESSDDDLVANRVYEYKRTRNSPKQNAASTSHGKPLQKIMRPVNLDSEEPGAVKNKENKSRGYKRSAAPLEGVQEETNDSVHDRNGELIESADDYPLSQRVDKYKRTRNTANRNEASTSREEPIGRNIHAPHLSHSTDRRTPTLLQKRQGTVEKINTESHGLRRFDIVNGKTYLGLDTFIGPDSWETTMYQKPNTFIREVALIIWEEEGILNRCLRLDKVSVSLVGRSPRKVFESDKLQLLKDLFEHYLKFHRFSQKDMTRHKKNLNNTLTRFVQDLRKPYKHLVRKQLF